MKVLIQSKDRKDFWSNEFGWTEFIRDATVFDDSELSQETMPIGSHPLLYPYVDGHTMVFADGSCDNKTGQGAWSCCIAEHGNQIISLTGHADNTTSNVMELEAVLNGLLLVDRLRDKNEPVQPVMVYTDSKYVYDLCKRETMLENLMNPNLYIPNKELILTLYATIRRTFTTVDFENVRGHAGLFYNEVCDSFASAVRKLAYKKVK